MEDKIEDLIAQMTLEEKVSMLAGADMWHTVPVERIGIPAIKVTDGPNGARGSKQRGGPSSACFPVGVALAATWNPDLVRQVGQALAEEVKAKGAHILLAPTVNIHRSPLAGRNFECYSEDPYLTGRMAVAYIDGLQSMGVGACIKHFVGNDSEFERTTMSSEIGERALREIYLAPFRMAVQEAKPWSVMSSYNKLNGTWCNENAGLLLGILKEEWGFDGIVMSDWYGTYTPNAAIGGLDLEMPGPARWMGQHVLDAVKSGAITEAMVDDRIRRLLRTIARAGAFEHPELAPEQAIDKPEHRRVARQAAAEAAVLLKNAGNLLPLDRARVRSVAVIGENAIWAQVEGGGSSHVTPHYVVSPYDGIVNKVGAGVAVGWEMGCPIHKMLPLVTLDWVTTTDGQQRGLTAHYFDNCDLSGEPANTELVDNTEVVWFGTSLPHVDASRFSVRWEGTLTVPHTGAYDLGLVSLGQSRLLIDGVQLIDNWSAPINMEEKTAQIEMTAGRAYRLTVEYAFEGDSHWRTLRLGCAPAVPADAMEAAVELASKSDVAIVVAGLTDEWESEGFDRVDMELPGRQAELIERVATANPNTVVVLNVGSPVAMRWIDKAAAVVQVWYGGQEAGNAIADVLFSDVNPSGKLPTTFPKRIQDNPAYINYPGENGKVLYGEGIFVGYRYYDKKDVEPLFPFGHGLSYTTFAYRNLTLSAAEYEPEDEIRVGVDVQNTGNLAGQEVVQLYVRDLKSSLARPEKELKAFAKVALEPGETRTITFCLGQDALPFYDPARGQWVVEPGEFEILVGSSSRDIRLTGRFTIGEGVAAAPAARLHTGLPLGVLLEDEAGKAILEKHIPEMQGTPDLSMAMGMSLDEIAAYVPHLLTEARLKAINEDLAAI
ncbi:MAG: glycoside hydrolase family 3 C-terminal domain-containing protein [Anaerolineae bacterium]|nr:glycoside hydrolase family 3 C-terminal domain-containing protein [Anaerolineae bacterium]